VDFYANHRALRSFPTRRSSDLRMLLGFGSGVKAQVGAIDSGNNTITLKNAMGVAGLGGAVFQFLPNESIRAATTPAGTTLRAGAMIVEDIYHATDQIKVDAIAT